MFWFGEMFVKAGWNIVPALNCQQAVSLAILWDSYIDLIIVNPGLDGITEMIETLGQVHRPKVLVIRNPDVDAGVPADGTIARPKGSASRAEWTEQIRSVLRRMGLPLDTHPDGGNVF